MKEVGKRLKALRESVGFSQVKMAEAIGSTQSSINRYENGQSTPPVEPVSYTHLNRRSRSFSFFSVNTSICFCMLFSLLTFSFKPSFSWVR